MPPLLSAGFAVRKSGTHSAQSPRQSRDHAIGGGSATGISGRPFSKIQKVVRTGECAVRGDARLLKEIRRRGRSRWSGIPSIAAGNSKGVLEFEFDGVGKTIYELRRFTRSGRASRRHTSNGLATDLCAESAT
jgi:hypothetical protein